MKTSKDTSAESFDNRAATWDENPDRIKLAKAAAEAIQKSVELRPDMKSFEYGCGTGLLGFLLKPFIGELILADTSAGMLREAEEKIIKSGIPGISTMAVDLSGKDIPGERFDLIFTQMTLHHITDYAAVAENFFKMLNPGGYLCIADLEEEDGSFHEGKETVHNGIDPSLLARVLSGKGLSVISRTSAHVIRRNGREYPVFLVTALKGK